MPKPKLNYFRSPKEIKMDRGDLPAERTHAVKLGLHVWCTAVRRRMHAAPKGASSISLTLTELRAIEGGDVGGEESTLRAEFESDATDIGFSWRFAGETYTFDMP